MKLISLYDAYSYVQFVWATAITALMDERRRVLSGPPMLDQLDEATLQRFVDQGRTFLQHHALTNPMIRKYL